MPHGATVTNIYKKNLHRLCLLSFAPLSLPVQSLSPSSGRAKLPPRWSCRPPPRPPHGSSQPPPCHANCHRLREPLDLDGGICTVGRGRSLQRWRSSPSASVPQSCILRAGGRIESEHRSALRQQGVKHRTGVGRRGEGAAAASSPSNTPKAATSRSLHPPCRNTDPS